MRLLNKSTTILLIILFFSLFNISCKDSIWDFDANTLLYCNVYDIIDSSFVENSIIYHVFNIENPDTINEDRLHKQYNSNTYEFVSIGGLHEGLLMTFHDGYTPDTTYIPKIKSGEEKTYNIYLHQKNEINHNN